MILDEKDISNITNRFTYDRELKGYAIKINDKIFITDRRKMTWNTKSAASLAFRNSYKMWVDMIAENKLIEQGYKESEIKNMDEYKNAWDDFKKYLIDNKIFQMVELKWEPTNENNE